MFNNNPYSQPGFGQAAQTQQAQAWPAQPAVGPPAPPSAAASPVTAAQAAQYSNYGYGSVPQRGGAGRGRGQNNAFQTQQAAFNPANPTAGPQFGPAQPAQVHAPPSQQGAGHPHKRPRFDSGNHANASLPQTPQYQQPQAQFAPMQQQGQIQYVYAQQQPQQPPPPAGPPPQMQPGQQYYQQPMQQAYPVQQQPMQQAFSPQPGVQQAVYYAQPGQPMMQMQPVQQGVQAYPQAQMYQQPMQMQQQNVQMQQPQAVSPPLAVAPMKPSGPTRGGPARRGGPGRGQHALPTAPHLHPPPPANEPPPPPAGPSGTNRGSGMTIKLSAKGAATLPPTPTGVSTGPSAAGMTGVPTGPASGVGIKRDTRPLPSQSSIAAAARQDRHQIDQRPPTGPSGRGGRGGAFAPRGGRGGPPTRGAFGGRGGFGRPAMPADMRSNASSSSNVGNKRTFSQTSVGGPANQKSVRPRANSNVTITSQTIPSGPSGKLKSKSAKFGQAIQKTFGSGPLHNSQRASSVFSTASTKAGGGQKKSLTDFRLEGLEIPELEWTWKATPLSVIMERMAIKDQARRQSVDTTATIEATEVPEVKVEQVDDELPAGGKEGEGSDAPAQTMPDSTAMQKSDSRREKRKHSADDEEEADGQHSGEGKASEVPVGKKVKSEAATQSSEPALTETAATAEAAIASEEDIAEAKLAATEGAEVEDATTNDEAAKAREPSEMSVTLETAPEGQETGDTAIEAGDDQEVAAASIIAGADATEEEATASANADTAEVKAEEPAPLANSVTFPSVPEEAEADLAEQRKFRENSRLRIYFTTPSENDFSPNKSGLRSQRKRLRAEWENSQADRAMSVETTATDVTARPNDEDTAAIEAPQNEQDNAEAGNNADDLDGEPLENEAGDAATEDAAEPSTAVVESGVQEKAEDAPAEAADIADAEEKKEESKEAVPSEPEPPHGIAGPLDLDKIIAAAEAKEGDDPSEEVEEAESPPEPSEDRISISYGRNTRRLIIDAEVIEELRIFRGDGRVELKVQLCQAESGSVEERQRICKGFAVEMLASEDGEFEEVARDVLAKAWPDKREDTSELEEGASDADELLPPLHRLLKGPASEVAEAEDKTVTAEQNGTDAESSAFTRGSLTIIAHLDQKFPLTEAKWVRSGKPDEWIETILHPPGRSVPQGQPALRSAWKGKIKVVDPEAPPAPPTFALVLENWLSAANQRLGFDEARHRFVSEHFKDINNVLEVLLRLIRGVNAYHYAANASPAFIAAVKESAPAHPEQQTPISLATFQLIKLGIEAAKEAGKPAEEMEKKVGEVLRNLPFFQICKSLDAIFNDYKRGTPKPAGAPPSSPGRLVPPRRPFQQMQKKPRKFM